MEGMAMQLFCKWRYEIVKKFIMRVRDRDRRMDENTTLFCEHGDRWVCDDVRADP